MPEYIEREALIARYDEEHIGEPGRARQLILEAPAVNVNEAMLYASNKAGIKITLDAVVMFAALLKRKINPEDCGRDVIQKIDSLVKAFREVAEQEEEELSMVIAPNPDYAVYREMTEAVESNDGYCPCAIERNRDTLCPCLEFRNQESEGECRCGRYVKKGRQDEDHV